MQRAGQRKAGDPNTQSEHTMVSPVATLACVSHISAFVQVRVGWQIASTLLSASVPLALAFCAEAMVKDELSLLLLTITTVAARHALPPGGWVDGEVRVVVVTWPIVDAVLAGINWFVLEYLLALRLATGEVVESASREDLDLALLWHSLPLRHTLRGLLSASHLLFSPRHFCESEIGGFSLPHW